MQRRMVVTPAEVPVKILDVGGLQIAPPAFVDLAEIDIGGDVAGLFAVFEIAVIRSKEPPETSTWPP